jgi:hypothetical protein
MPDKLALKVSASAAISVVQAARDVFRKLRSKPSAAEAKILVEFVKRLDERRVFSAPYDAEVVESCIGSLASFKNTTEEYLAKLDHAGARAALGAILTSLRRFLDKWHGFSTRALGDPWEPPIFGHGRNEKRREFFEDLGHLRAEVLILVDLLRQLEPKVRRTNAHPE